MTDPELYIKEGLKIIERFVDEENYQAALKGCHELLKINPYHRKLLSYLETVEELILETNERKINADISATKHMWKEKRYQELFAIYSKLLQYSPNHKKLRGLLQKLSETLTENQLQERAAYVRQMLGITASRMGEKRFSEALQAAKELLVFDPLNERATEFSQEASRAIVDQKLKENERLALSADYEGQCQFYENMLAIVPDHEEVKRRLLQSKAHLAEQKLLADKIHLNESVARVKELFQQAEYEKALQSCEEILRLDPKNFTAKTYRAKSRRMIHDEIETLAHERMRKATEEMLPEFEKNREGFVVV